MKIIVKILFSLLAIGFMCGIAVILYLYLVLVPKLPQVRVLEDTEFQVPLRIYDKNEYLLAEYGEHRRIPVSFENIPEILVQAFLAAEDDDFWNHYGVDPLAIMAAVYEVVSTGQKTRGGSTITMQVARNFFLTPEQTYKRKLNEILLALKIERELSKEKIFELYVNKIFFGHRAYGIVAAAQVYYGKTLDELTPAQAAMIAGLPKAPSRYNPISDPRRSLIRRDHILGRMAYLGYIDDQIYDQALAEPITAELHAIKVSSDARYVAEMVRAELFAQYGDAIYRDGLKVYTTIDDRLQIAANKALRKALMDYDRRHGFRGVQDHIDLEQVEIDPFEDELLQPETIGGLKKAVVKSTDDHGFQAYLPNFELVTVAFEGGVDWAGAYINENATGPKPKQVSDVVNTGDVVWLEQREEQWLLAQLPDVEGAIISIDPANGAIRALVGGFDYFYHKFNRVTQAHRQPGSNFKPFIYSAALEKGFTAATLVNDAPVVFEDDSLEATWRPENYSGKFYGPTRLREALVKSRNLVSIRVLQAIGLRYATRYVERFGFDRNDLPYDLSLSLGSASVTPQQIVRGYAVFANGGYLINPYFIERIESREGEILFQNKPVLVCQGCEARQDAQDQADQEQLENTEDESLDDELIPVYAPRVISEQNAYIMRSIIKEVVRRGTGVRAKQLGRSDIGGKTGTTNDQKDAWFSGFNDQIVTTSWVGFDDQKPLGRRETGGRAALPMWIDFMRVALDGMPINLEEQPQDVITVRIDEESGNRATPQSSKTRFELFIKGTEPMELQDFSEGQPGAEGSVPIVPTEESSIEEEIF